MATTLELIDHTFIDRQSRQTIRSHVMKGKNVGKVRLHKRRPSHSAGINKGAQVTSITPLSRRDEQREEMEKRRKKFEEQVKICPKLLARMGNELSGLSSACEMSSQSRKYVHDFLLFAGEAAYPSEFCKNMPDPNLTLWFQYMLVDEAYFHCFVALSEACIDFVNSKEDCSPEYRQHIVKGLRLINEKLSSESAVADTSLAAVIALCLLSSVREQPHQTKIHFEGLCRMIEVRGGMSELKGNHALMEKVQR
jgi:hypothetical protein